LKNEKRRGDFMMNNMEHNNLKNLLENITEQPSQGCWSNIESQLNVLFPQAASQSVIQGSGTTASKTGSIFAKVAAAPFKAAAITGSVALVTAVSIMAIHSLNKTQQAPSNLSKMDQNTQVILPLDTNNQKQDTFRVSETKEKKKNAEDEEIAPTSTTAINPNYTASTSQNVVIVNNTSPISNSVIPVQQAIPEKPVLNSKPIANQVSNQHDPIIQNQDIPESVPVKITIPNIFTPNGDGYNDLFIIEGLENCVDPRLIVKNSSGKTIFQSSDYQNDWNAENCPDGVYIYYFVYKVNKIEEKMMGKVIIKR
jgi:gliding motility-associated-like protein